MDTAPKLWVAYNESRTDENRNALVVHYIKEYRTIIWNKCRQMNMHFNEIKSAAAVGLMEAVERFDPSQASFKTWAVGLIRNRILDYCREIDPMPRSLRQFKNRRDSCNSELPEEQAIEMSLSLDRFNHLSRELRLSMNLLDRSTVGPLAVKLHEIGCVDEVIEEDARIYLLRDFLPPVHFDIILMYYRYGLTYKQIADIHERTESWACQMCKKAVRSLGVEYFKKAS